MEEINSDSLCAASDNLKELRNKAFQEIKKKQQEIVGLNELIISYDMKINLIKRVYQFKIKEDSEKRCIDILKQYL